jgi:uncharacterized RDD family membrane protein YckC
MGDWTEKLRLETSTRGVAEVEAPDAGLLCTENEVLFINANGVQRAPLSEITKVSRDGPDLVIAGSSHTFIRGTISSDKLTLANFFAEVRQAAANARSKREVLLDTGEPVDLRPPPATVQPSFTAPVAAPSSVPAVRDDAMNLGRPLPVAPPPVVPLPSASFGQDVNAATRGDALPRMSQPPRMGNVGAEPVALQFQPGSFWWRLLAYVIDSVLLSVVATVLFLILGGGSILSLIASAGADGNLSDETVIRSVAGLLGAYFLWLLLVGVGSWLYYALLESGTRQGTVGKMAVGLFVSNLDGQRISFSQASGRFWSKIGVSIAVGFVLGLVTLPLGRSAGSISQWLSFLIILYTYVMSALTPRKQTLYDQISGTLVWKR